MEKPVEQALQAQSWKKGDQKKGKFHEKAKFRKGKEEWRNQKKGDGNFSKQEQHRKYQKKGDGKPNLEKKKVDRSKVQCWTCQKTGHFSNECWYNTGESSKQINEAM
ncbi:Zinc finger, CCHC-type [Sesbania bispinosa]|nr:Zinc finger, CCHC-type [Sesbania bispinosa]